MTFDADALRQQIPHYLTADPARKEFLKGLRELCEGADKGYFFPPNEDPYTKEVLQGDGWQGFQIFSYTSGNRIAVRGIVLTNSCDISPDNQRVLPPNITFAPIIKLSKLKERFEELGLRSEQIKTRMQAIRSQTVTNIFYLPADGPLQEEYVALLDDLHSMPVVVFHQAAEKIFTLSMIGFYLFIFKLSNHFCRLQGADRDAQNATT